MKNSLIIVSGGMDSITLLHKHANEIALAISYNYGSKHNEKEIPFAKEHCSLIGKELGIDYSKTWTCYKGGEKHCGVCGSCIERKEALEGFDNTVYL